MTPLMLAPWPVWANLVRVKDMEGLDSEALRMLPGGLYHPLSLWTKTTSHGADPFWVSKLPLSDSYPVQ